MFHSPPYESSQNSTSFMTNPTYESDVSIYRYSMRLSVLLISGYAQAGLLSYLCMIFTIIRGPSMRSATNYLIVNLAVVDIIALLVCVPSNLLFSLIQRK